MKPSKKGGSPIPRANKVSLLVLFVLSLSGMLWPAGCATPAKPGKTGCDADIAWQVMPEAQITRFDCEVGQYKGHPALIFTVSLRNVGEKPARYRLSIFLLDADKAAGYPIPRKGQPPVLEPGKTETIKIPFLKTAQASKKILVVVKTAGD